MIAETITPIAGGACVDGVPVGLAVGEIATPLGPMVAAASSRGVCLLEFTDRGASGVGVGAGVAAQMATVIRRLGATAHGRVSPAAEGWVASVRRELEAYFAGELRAFETPLDLAGTAFQVRVWEALRQIGYGRRESHGGLARHMGAARATRAVAAANGANRVAIMVPCHRVVAADGRLWGYAGGLERKAFLLDLEARSAGGAGVDSGTAAVGTLFAWAGRSSAS